MPQYSVIVEETITNIYIVAVEAPDEDLAEILAHDKVAEGKLTPAETETYIDTESINEEYY